jgi:nickel/cobalt transporter (NicO) family protein
MLQIIIGSSLLSLTHALLPHHWLPLTAASKSEKWTVKETIRITILIALMHTFSTIVIGIIIGLIGYNISSTFQSLENILAPAVLTGLGIFFVIRNILSLHNQHEHYANSHHDFRNSPHHHDHSAHNHMSEDKIRAISKKSKRAIIFAIGSMMVFSPCIEIEAFYFTAGRYGWIGILALSFIYFIITITVMILLVILGKKGLEQINKKLHFLEHYSRAISGSILIILGVLTIFIQF